MVLTEKCTECGAVKNKNWPTCFVCGKPSTEQKESSSTLRVKEESCQSVQYTETGLVSCGSGWFCDGYRGAGNGLKKVTFWSERLSAWLDLEVPEKDLYDYKKVMKARTCQEEKEKT